MSVPPIIFQNLREHIRMLTHITMHKKGQQHRRQECAWIPQRRQGFSERAEAIIMLIRRVCVQA